MANVKTTTSEWAKCREYFEAGLSLSKIEAKTGISKSQIGKKSNADGWAKATGKAALIAEAVRIEGAKATLNETALDVHKELVSEQTKYILFFNTAALKNTQQAMAAPCDNQNDFRARADTITKGREVVLGKAPDTVISNVNAVQNNAKLVYEVVR